MFFSPFKGVKPEDHEAIVRRAVELDAQERRRGVEAKASPLAKEIARLLREEPEAWKADYPLMRHSNGLDLRTYGPISAYSVTSMTVEKGGKRTDLSGDDVSLLSYAEGEWRGWRNKQHADDILAELTSKI